MLMSPQLPLGVTYMVTCQMMVDMVNTNYFTTFPYSHFYPFLPLRKLSRIVEAIASSTA